MEITIFGKKYRVGDNIPFRGILREIYGDGSYRINYFIDPDNINRPDGVLCNTLVEIYIKDGKTTRMDGPARVEHFLNERLSKQRQIEYLHGLISYNELKVWKTEKIYFINGSSFMNEEEYYKVIKALKKSPMLEYDGDKLKWK